jgi:Na+-driven multidrug efflux pump
VLLDTPPEIFDTSLAYLQTIFIGCISFGLYNIIASIMRGLGDSITPLLFLLITTR